MDYLYEFSECKRCGKEFLVERVMIGINHTINTLVTCKECIDLPKEYKKERPQATKDIKKWIKKINRSKL